MIATRRGFSGVPGRLIGLPILERTVRVRVDLCRARGNAIRREAAYRLAQQVLGGGASWLTQGVVGDAPLARKQVSEPELVETT